MRQARRMPYTFVLCASVLVSGAQQLLALHNMKMKIKTSIGSLLKCVSHDDNEASAKPAGRYGTARIRGCGVRRITGNTYKA